MYEDVFAQLKRSHSERKLSVAYLGASVVRTKHYPHPFLEDGPGVAPGEVGPFGLFRRNQDHALKPKRADLNIAKIGSSRHRAR